MQLQLLGPARGNKCTHTLVTISWAGREQPIECVQQLGQAQGCSGRFAAMGGTHCSTVSGPPPSTCLLCLQSVASAPARQPTMSSRVSTKLHANVAALHSQLVEHQARLEQLPEAAAPLAGRCVYLCCSLNQTPALQY